MSTHSSAPAAHVLSWLWIGPAAIATAIKRWCGAFIAWRAERRAIAELEELSDYSLKDIGLSRSQIKGVIREHHRAF